MLEPQVVIFHKDDIDRIIHECLTHSYCKIMVAVRNTRIKDTASMFFEHIDPKVLARPIKINHNYTQIIFTNGADLSIVKNTDPLCGCRVSKIYCSPDTTIEAYFYTFLPQLFDYKYILQNIKAEEAEKRK